MTTRLNFENNSSLPHKSTKRSSKEYHDAKINANNYEKLHIFAVTIEFMNRTRKISDDIHYYTIAFFYWFPSFLIHAKHKKECRLNEQIF